MSELFLRARGFHLAAGQWHRNLRAEPAQEARVNPSGAELLAPAACRLACSRWRRFIASLRSIAGLSASRKLTANSPRAKGDPRDRGPAVCGRSEPVASGDRSRSAPRNSLVAEPSLPADGWRCCKQSLLEAKAGNAAGSRCEWGWFGWVRFVLAHGCTSHDGCRKHHGLPLGHRPEFDSGARTFLQRGSPTPTSLASGARIFRLAVPSLNREEPAPQPPERPRRADSGSRAGGHGGRGCVRAHRPGQFANREGLWLHPRSAVRPADRNPHARTALRRRRTAPLRDGQRTRPAGPPPGRLRVSRGLHAPSAGHRGRPVGHADRKAPELRRPQRHQATHPRVRLESRPNDLTSEGCDLGQKGRGLPNRVENFYFHGSGVGRTRPW